MEKITKIYIKYRSLIENILFPVVLLLYPFLKISQGLDVADTTYSLANFQYFGQLNGTWMVATFLSNAAGSLLMHLPFGGTLIGMYFYTALVQSAIALMVYLALRKRMSAPFLFVGEFLALGLCWCPSTILYHYLTYLLLTAAILLLYFGLTGSMTGGNDSVLRAAENDIALNRMEAAVSRRQRIYFVAAGVCLGLNVAVRMPNVVQAALILAMWYGIILQTRGKKEAASDRNAAARGGKEAAGRCVMMWHKLVQTTLWCLLGYLLGFGVPFLAVCLRYGFTAYPDMVHTMFAMTEKATDYKPVSMLAGMFSDYGTGLCWLAFAAACIAAGAVAFWVLQNVAKQENKAAPRLYKITSVITKAVYSFLLLMLLRVYWGRGMFTFQYYAYDYRSIYYPAVLFLLVTVFLCLCCMFGKRAGQEEKILAAFVLLEIFLTPLGSNNALMPIINNLFLAVPFTLKAAKQRISTAVWAIPFVMLTVFLLIQSIGFHSQFVFQDGIWGEARDTKAELPRKAAGVYTNQENAALLQELALYMQEEGLNGREAITYGELPGLHYLLDLPPALSTCWADLDSYRMTEYGRDLAAVGTAIAAGEEAPVIILSAPVAAYLSDDGEAIGWFGVDVEAMAADEKLQMLSAFMQEYGYAESFWNAKYVVFIP